MGMDVYGRDPKNKNGEYFRASIWSWRPINELNDYLGRDLLTEDTLEKMWFNDGCGPESDNTCQQLASRFDTWLRDNTNGMEVECETMRINRHPNENGCHTFTDALDPETTRSAYRADNAHIKEWVSFLRNCGGFEVW